MKHFIFALLLVLVYSVSTEAAVVYLNKGGQIKANKVWREKGMVVVLINHESITSFSAKEINLRKTFPHRRKAVKPKVSSTVPTPLKSAGEAVTNNAAPTTEKGGKKINLPRLSIRLPEREPPKAGEGGAIRKQKKEMEERLNE